MGGYLHTKFGDFSISLSRVMEGASKDPPPLQIIESPQKAQSE